MAASRAIISNGGQIPGTA